MSVIQALCLSILNEIASYHMLERVLPVIPTAESIADDSHTMETTLSNATIAFTDVAKSSAAGQSFHFSVLPHNVACHSATLVLLYFWNMWLERTFPARPRRSPIFPETTEPERLDDNEQTEPKIVKKWNAHSKFQRSTVSWSNTLIKWLLDLSVGNFVASMLWIVIEQLTEFHHPTKLISKTVIELKRVSHESDT